MAMNFKEGRWNHEINVTDFVKPTSLRMKVMHLS